MLHFVYPTASLRAVSGGEGVWESDSLSSPSPASWSWGQSGSRQEGNWHGRVSGERSRLCRGKATACSGVQESNLQRKDRGQMMGERRKGVPVSGRTVRQRGKEKKEGLERPFQVSFCSAQEWSRNFFSYLPRDREQTLRVPVKPGKRGTHNGHSRGSLCVPRKSSHSIKRETLPLQTCALRTPLFQLGIFISSLLHLQIIWPPSNQKATVPLKQRFGQSTYNAAVPHPK